MGWRRDHFSGLGKLEGDVQLCVTSRERLQSKTCLSALLPEISHMGKLVLGESVGSGGPRSLRGHGRTPAGIRTSARWPSEDFHRQSQTLRGGLSTRPFCNLLRSGLTRKNLCFSIYSQLPLIRQKWCYHIYVDKLREVNQGSFCIPGTQSPAVC